MTWRFVAVALFCLTTILVIFTFVPIFARKAHTTSDQIDILLHRGNPPDYAIYLATITMGQSGKLFFRNYFSPAETKPLPIHSYYWLTGFLTAPFRLWQPYAYHLARILTVFAYGGVLYLLMRSVFSFPWQGLTAVMLILLMPIMPDMFYRQDVAASFMRWWVEFLSPVNRLDPPPHHLAAQVLLLLAIACYLFYRRKQQLRFMLMSAVAIVGSVFMVPQTVLPFLVMVSVDFVIFRSLSSIALAATTIGAVGLLSFSLNDTRWIPNQIWEIDYWRRDPFFYYHLYISFFPLIVGAIPAIVNGIRKKDTIRILLLAWALTPLLIAPFTHLFGMGTGRLIQTGIHIPLAILTVFTLTDATKTNKIPIAILVFLAVFNGIRLPLDAKAKWNEISAQPYAWTFYIPKNVYDTALWIKNNLPADTKLIGVESVGNIIVSFAPVIVYQGDQTHGYNWDLDLSTLWAFYGRRMTDTEALTWLREQKITYVVDSVTAGWNTTDRPAYPFLTPVWKNDGMRIYRVQ